MKKDEWKAAARESQETAWLADSRARGLAAEVERLTREVETMRRHWAPVPIPHPWSPRDPKCAFCDDPRDHTRHNTE